MKKIILVIALCINLVADFKDLSLNTRTLVLGEMNLIENGMHEIFSAIIRGDLIQVQKIASNIETSYVLSKKITESEKKELATLPKRFFEIDRELHETAGKLSLAAEFEDTNEVIQLYGDLSSKCVKCHLEFAKNRFKSF